METYEDGLKTISIIIDCRKKINHVNNVIENARFRISQNPSDDMWKKILREYEEMLILYQNEEKTQSAALMILENKIDSESFNKLLEQYGIAIASTSSFEHVSDSIHDEYDLHKSINATEQAIRNLKYKLDNLDSNNINDKIICESELEYYINDMKSHPWGEMRLKELNLTFDEDDRRRGV